jgi:3-deoxy-D-manno-octulosonic acid kinase
MAGIDTSENLIPFRDAAGEGAILFDAKRLRQAEPGWFDPAWWGAQSEPVGRGGRGAAWFVNQAVDKPEVDKPAVDKRAADGGNVPAKVAGFGPAVLRHYLRGGVVAKFSRDRHLWRGPGRIRSFDEFRLLRALARLGLPVPSPIAAIYRRAGWGYRASILLDRLPGVRSLADLAAGEDDPTLWQRAGELIALFHRAGVDHVDLNAQNILFGREGEGWIIDLDRSQVRIPETAWREANLRRLERSLLKLRGTRSPERVQEEMRRLHEAYDAYWRRGI